MPRVTRSFPAWRYAEVRPSREALEQDERSLTQATELLMEFVRFSHTARVMVGRVEPLRGRWTASAARPQEKTPSASAA